MTCNTCDGSGIIVGASYHDGLEADHVARCDTCQRYPGDLQALFALCKRDDGLGAWAVWAETFDGCLPATEAPLLYKRSDPGSAACLQAHLLHEHEEEPGVPSLFAMVRFVSDVD